VPSTAVEDAPDTRERIAACEGGEDDGKVETGCVTYASNSTFVDSHMNIVASAKNHPWQRRGKWLRGRKRV